MQQPCWMSPDSRRVDLGCVELLPQQTDRGVESGFLLMSEDASALHASLGAALHLPAAPRN